MNPFSQSISNKRLDERFGLKSTVEITAIKKAPRRARSAYFHGLRYGHNEWRSGVNPTQWYIGSFSSGRA
jgi:hypothetical protein